MRIDCRIHHGVRALTALLLLTAPLGMCQQQFASGPTQDPIPAPSTGVEAQNPSSATDLGRQQPLPAGSSQGFLIRALNSANPLEEDNGPIQWGWFSVRSACFLQYFSHLSFSNRGLPFQSQDINSSQFSTSIVMDHAFRTSHLSLQYDPGLFITNGAVYSNALNQSAGLDTTFQLNPRWGLYVSDRVNYYASQRYFSETSLDTNYLTGTSVPKNFLDGPGSVLNNSATASFTYLWSPLTTITFAPSFDYQYGTGAVFSGNNISASYEGGRFSLSHQLSPTRTIGLNYSGQYAQFTDSTARTRPQSDTVLHDFLLTYGQQLARTWWLSVGAGISSDAGSNGGSFLALNATITKSFHRTEFAISYNRGHQFNGFITSAASDRVDGVQTIYWSHRFSTVTSLAYFKDVSRSPFSQSASYASQQLKFDLTRQLSFTAGGTYVDQKGDGVFVASGIRRFATVGITWKIAPPFRN